MSTSPVTSPREPADAPSTGAASSPASANGYLQRAASHRAVRWLLAALGALLVIAVLTPALQSGMRGDDSHVQLDIQGALKTQDQSLPAYIGDMLEAGLDNGRPMPVGVSEGLAYAASVPERVPYKLGIVLLAIAALAALYAFVRRLGLGSLSTFLIVCVAFALSLQFRATHDPVLGYSGTQEFGMVILFGGLYAYLRYLQGGRWLWYAAALALTVALVLNYEANPPLVLAFAALHLGHDPRRQRSWKVAIPFLAIGAAMALTSVVTHSTATAVEGYQESLKPITVIQVAIRQALSGIPGIYFASGAQGVLGDPTKPELAAAAWRAALLGAVLLAALLLVRGVPRRTSAPAGSLAAAGVGVVLMTCSGLFISLAAQHQQLIFFGGGHLATFAGTLGFVLLAVAAWSTWGDRVASSWLAVAGLVGVAGVMAFFGQLANLRVVAIEWPGIQQRELTRAALKHGVLSGLPQTTTIYVNNRDLGWNFGNLIFYPDTIDYLAYLETDRQYDIRPDGTPPQTCGAAGAFPVDDCAEPSRRVAIFAPRASRGGGSAIVASGVPAGKLATAGATEITVLARGASATGAVPSLAGTTASGRPWSPRSIRWTKTSAGGGWVRYTARVTRPGPLAWSLTDPRSPVDFTNPQKNIADSLARQFGTKHLLP